MLLHACLQVGFFDEKLCRYTKVACKQQTFPQPS
jgi:hypothetical protein